MMKNWNNMHKLFAGVIAVALNSFTNCLQQQKGTRTTSYPPGIYLLKVNLFKANKKDTKKYLMLTFIKLLPSSVVSIVDFEQENTNWVVSLL